MNSKFTVISVSLASMMPDFPYIQTINDSTIIWINDVFNQKDLLKLLQDRNPAYIVSDHLSTVEHLPYQIYSAPMFLADTTRLIVNNLPGYQNFETRKNFNFIINKKNINRYLCLKLVEMFQLKNFNYTWSGVDKNFDLANIISEVKLLGSNSPLNQDQFSMLMHPVNITPYFIDAPKNNTNNSFIIYQNNSWTWNHGLNDIFSSSAVSLITESLRFQKKLSFSFCNLLN